MPKELQAHLEYIQNHFRKEGYPAVVTLDQENHEYTARLTGGGCEGEQWIALSNNEELVFEDDCGIEMMLVPMDDENRLDEDVVALDPIPDMDEEEL